MLSLLSCRLVNQEDPGRLTRKLLDVLEGCPLSLQRDIIAFLPEVLADDDQEHVANRLRDVFESSSELLVPALDALASLRLPLEMQEALTENVRVGSENAGEIMMLTSKGENKMETRCERRLHCCTALILQHWE